MKAAVVKETSPGERRVALVPDAIARLRPAGIDVLVESGAGEAAWLSDAVYADAGDRYCRVPTLVRLGETYRASGNSEATRDLWQQALAILDGVRDPGAGLIRAKLRTMNLVLD